MTRKIAGLREIAGQFDGVLVDQFGVLHDGRTPFPGARECLNELNRVGVPIVALSNSGRRAAPNADRLERLSFTASLFAGVVTSGELAHAEIARRLADGRLRPGAAIAILSRDDDVSVIDGLEAHRVSVEKRADLLLIAGVEPERRGLERYEAMIEPHARRRVPAICANPDEKIYVEDRVDFGPGVLAARYRTLGGETLMLGKPAAAMFEAGLAALEAPDPMRVLMIGDSPAHDIAGAAAAGCRTLLVEAGVQANLSASDANPDFAITTLVW